MHCKSYLLIALLAVAVSAQPEPQDLEGIWFGSVSGNELIGVNFVFEGNAFQYMNQEGEEVKGAFSITNNDTIPLITFSFVGEFNETEEFFHICGLISTESVPTGSHLRSIKLVCLDPEDNDITGFNATNCADCTELNIVWQECPASKVAVVNRNELNFPLRSAKQILIGFGSQYESPDYRYSEVTSFGLHDAWMKGKFYRSRYADLVQLLNVTDSAFLTEFYGRAAYSTRAVQTAIGFTQGIYLPSPFASKVENETTFVIPISPDQEGDEENPSSEGLNAVPIFSNPLIQDTLFFPEVTCPAYRRRSLDFSAAENDVQIQTASEIFVQFVRNLTWTNTGLVGEAPLNATISFSRLIEPAQNLSDPSVQYALAGFLLDTVVIDELLGNPPLGPENADLVTPEVRDAMVTLDNRLTYLSVSNRTLAAVASQPILKDIEDWFQDLETTLPDERDLFSDFVGSDDEANQIGTKLRQYVGNDRGLQAVATFLCFINQDNQLHYPEGAIMHFELQQCNDSKQVYTEFNAVPTPVCNCTNPCPLPDFLALLSESTSLNYTTVCGIETICPVNDIGDTTGDNKDGNRSTGMTLSGAWISSVITALVFTLMRM